MKTLYLLRHAKSSWADSDLPDFERPLKNKGQVQAESMANQVASLLPPPQRIFCSSAFRTRQTLPPFLEVWGLDESQVTLDINLYVATDKKLLEFVRQLPAAADIVLLVGHNPGLTDLVNHLTHRDLYIKNIPPAGFVQIDFDVANWQDALAGAGDLKLNMRPKELAR